MSAKKPTPAAASPGSPRWAEPAFYGSLAAVTLVILAFVLRLWEADLRIPLQYEGDALFAGASIKGMIENGLAWANPHLGAPGSMNLLDFPGTDLLHFTAIKVMSFAVAQWALVTNLYYLLGFVVVALAAAWSLRRLGVSRQAAFAGAVLYTFLPFHFLHGQTHIFLSFYFQVPLLCVLAIELQAAVAPLVKGEGSGAKLELTWERGWLPFLICVLTGVAGIYYALFGCIFLLLGGLRGWWRTGERARAFSAGIMIAVILAVTVACLAPYVWYRHTAGPDPQVAARSFVEAEVYGLKIVQMVLPVRDHRIAFLARVREHYVSAIAGTFGAFTDSESDFVALGLLGALGFIGLVGLALFGWRRRSYEQVRLPLDAVAALTVGGTLLGTVGGFGTIIALGFTQIRAYSRISVFIAFFAIVAVCAFFDWVTERAPKDNRLALAWIIAVGLVIVGVFDQTTAAMVPQYEQIKADWVSTGTFVRSIESTLPDGAEVLQLPYVPFPENPPVVNMTDYDHFRPYAQSTKIHWSYGAVKGRPDAEWDSQVSAMVPAQMVPAIKAKGFVGVWVDRAGYQDQGAAIMASLATATASQPRVSSDGRYAFFTLGK